MNQTSICCAVDFQHFIAYKWRDNRTRRSVRFVVQKPRLSKTSIALASIRWFFYSGWFKNPHVAWWKASMLDGHVMLSPHFGWSNGPHFFRKLRWIQILPAPADPHGHWSGEPWGRSRRCQGSTGQTGDFIRKKMWDVRWMVAKSCITLDGWHPVKMGKIIYQLVQDFFHPQYGSFIGNRTCHDIDQKYVKKHDMSERMWGLWNGDVSPWWQ